MCMACTRDTDAFTSCLQFESANPWTTHCQQCDFYLLFCDVFFSELQIQMSLGSPNFLRVWYTRVDHCCVF